MGGLTEIVIKLCQSPNLARSCQEVMRHVILKDVHNRDGFLWALDKAVAICQHVEESESCWRLRPLQFGPAGKRCWTPTQSSERLM